MTIRSENMAVLLVGNFLSASNGSRGVCEELALRLPGSGWPVLTTSDRPHRVSRLADMIGTAWHARRQYAVAQVDVFSGPAFLLAEVVCGVLTLLGKPFVLTLHGGNLPEFAGRCPRRVRRLLQKAAVVTVPSRYLLETMQPYRSDLRLVPNALDVSAYPFRQRRLLNPTLVWLRAFHAVYNPEMAIRVVALLSRDVGNLSLVMIGPDKGDGSLERARQLATRLGVAERIRWPGWVAKSEVADLLGQADILLNTATIDNTPVSVLEAMACGLCVVSTEVGGIPHMLEADQDALLVPSDCHQDMANGVRRLLSDPDLAERLSRRGRARTLELDWSVISAEWRALLAAAARGSH